MAQTPQEAIARFAYNLSKKKYSPTQTAYAILRIDTDAAGVDSFCVLLPAASRPLLPDGPDPMFEATFNGKHAAWQNESGQTVLLGSDDEPLNATVADKLATPDGALVLFINELTAMPETWAVCKSVPMNA